MLAFHLKGVLLAVLAGVAAGVATRLANRHVQAGWVVLAVVAVFLVALLVGAVRRTVTTYTVTDRRLVIERGLLTREQQETRLERVQNVACRQTVRQRLLRVGTVHFDTAAGADFDFSFVGVAHPRELVRAVDRALQDMPREWVAPRGTV